MTDDRDIIIKAEGLTLIFGKRKKEALELLNRGYSKTDILKKTRCTIGVNKASFEIKKGEIFVIMGLSGSGKSSLIRCLNRLNEPTDGKVYFKDHNITRETNKQLLHTRRTEMSMVFQKFGLLPHRTILENAAFGLEIRGETREQREEKARIALKTVGLEGYEEQYPRELSGGMQQRVGLARALANDTDVLLMDEAFSALDPLIKSDMQDELLQIQNKLHKTIVFITHDLNEAMKVGDRIAIMKDGVIEQIGTAETILTSPATDYVEAFVERVDRKTIITAETLLFKHPTTVKLRKTGPKGVLHKMREAGLNVLPVVDNLDKFLGYVWLEDMIDLEKRKVQSIESALYSEVPSVLKSYTVEEMLPLITGHHYPLAVVDEEDGRLLGLVTQTSLIIESTRYSKTEMNELIDNANDL